jgi:hypothetical protein
MENDSVVALALKDFSIHKLLFDVATKHQIKIITDEKIKSSDNQQLLLSQRVLLNAKTNSQKVTFEDDTSESCAQRSVEQKTIQSYDSRQTQRKQKRKQRICDIDDLPLSCVL